MTNKVSPPSLNRARSPSTGSRVPCKSIVTVIVFGALIYLINMEERSFLKLNEPTELPSQMITLPKARYDTQNTKQLFALDESNEFIPGIAWLMSYPKSGTSYTMTMVAWATNKSFATNYGDEALAKGERESLSIYPRRLEGPYWPGMGGTHEWQTRPLPDTYVITNTHCSAFCLDCGPREYVVTPSTFLKKCASGHARIPPARRRIDVRYDPSRVMKAIHLIRNPMHNIIARYRLDHKVHVYTNDKKWLKKHPNDAKGLHAYCKDAARKYRRQDERFFGKGKVPKAPCYGEFFKYTQWHNLVHEGLDLIEHDVPVLTVYYEDYADKLNETTTQIFDFLELDQVLELKEFEELTEYADYFSDVELREIKNLVKRVASKKTWSQVQHYFDF